MQNSSKSITPFSTPISSAMTNSAADRGDVVRKKSALILAQWNACVKIYQILTGLGQSGDLDICRLRSADISNFF
ncbi:hypothetical protein E4U45_002172 [Claviceps purpurea]|nr:hypothetical protein E4U45_002172 [Claviceps purpurea]